MVLIFISLMAVDVEQLIMHYNLLCIITLLFFFFNNVAFGDVLAC